MNNSISARTDNRARMREDPSTASSNVLRRAGQAAAASFRRRFGARGAFTVVVT
jgi:hypothetical protein